MLNRDPKSYLQRNAKALERLFIETLRLCAEARLVKAGLVALDGTKIKANAALSANRTHRHLEANDVNWTGQERPGVRKVYATGA